MQTIIGLGRQARDPGAKTAEEGGEKSAPKGDKGKKGAVEEKLKLIPMKQPLSEMIIYLSDEQVRFAMYLFFQMIVHCGYPIS
jgi:hypothetical protein